ncbi:MAG: hypothetical protein AUI83_17060 [Armatimonadetes bacterium 13_1_40CM_3_65_7]|nr:MAG: hypothetical protein AUI83_17060 [Armatimonadetes bacterium 13_1_40CM_3_65_7]
MTELLYLHDSYLREFDATVEAQSGQAVSLDRTSFYVGGGGQPADAGMLQWTGGECRVAEVRRAADGVWHAVERRYAIMRHHSALHVLVGVVYKQFNALVTGGAIYPDRARMDFSLEDLDKERVAAIEAEANRVIAESRRILVRFVSREEFERSDLTRLARNLLPPEIREVRVVEIEGFDAQADGGTHVHSTTEIGRLAITKTENKGKINRRLEIALSSGSPR